MRPTRWKMPSSRARPSAEVASTRRSSASPRAANLRARPGGSGSDVARPRDHQDARLSARGHRDASARPGDRGVDHGPDACRRTPRESRPSARTASPARRRGAPRARGRSRSARSRARGLRCRRSRQGARSRRPRRCPGCRPRACRSRRGRGRRTRSQPCGRPSEAEGSTSARASSSARASAGGSSRRSHLAPPRASPSATSVSVPWPTRCSSAAGDRRRDEPPGRGEPLDVLVALEHAHEEDARRVGNRARPARRTPSGRSRS